MLDGISARVDGGLYCGFLDGVDGDLEMVAVRLFDSGGQFRNREVHIGGDFDDIDVLEDILPDGCAGTVGAINEQKLLIEDRVCEGGIQVLKIVAARDQLASCSQDPGAGNAACIDRV